MSKFLKTAAEVVGAVALIATGVGAAAGVGIGLGLSASTLATVAAVAKLAGLAAALLSVGAALTAKKQTAGGSPEEWKADPDAGIDLVFGDAYNSGHIIYRQSFGDTNKYETLVTCWSLGPVDGINQLYVDQIATAVNGDSVQIPSTGHMHEGRQRGLCPEAGVLEVAPINPWHWTAQHKLSGLAATMVTCEYDSKSKHPLTSIPNCGWRGKGLLCYDPRRDDTYPGGAGPQRSDDQSTWVWSTNPYVIALTWCIGWRQNGHLVAGVGLPLTGLLIDMFVEGANIADANKWTCGGVKSTLDDKWDVLKDILQAGGGEPLRLGALLGVTINTPRVSLATITRDDLAQGEISIAATQARRDRINAVSPRYQLETLTTIAGATAGTTQTSTTWAEQVGTPIVVDSYVQMDGRQRRKEISYPLVQCFAGGQPTQAAQLARYDLENAREFGPLSLPLKIRWMGYKPGDVVTIDLPEADLHGQDVLLMHRALEPSTGVVTITARSETAAKHAFALGQTAVAPATPSLPANAWSMAVPGLPTRGSYWLSSRSALTLSSDQQSITIGAFTGVLDDGEQLQFAAGGVTALTAGTQYGVFLARDTGAYFAEASPALDASASDNNVFLGWQATQSADGTYPAAPAGGGGYGGTGDTPRMAQE